MRKRQVQSGRDGKRGELALLELIRRRTAGQRSHGVRLGIGDDCALLLPRPDEELCVTTDLSIEGRHFRLDWHPPEAVGHRVLARGLSDLAAMGARPVAAFLSLGLPGTLTVANGRQRAWVDRFLDGLLDLAKDRQAPLAGGDLAESPVALADIVLVGATPRGKALLRSGGRPGDSLYVTGTLGGAAAALARLASMTKRRKSGSQSMVIPAKLRAALAPHLYPQPRVVQGLWLLRHGLATAAMDLSDGLSTDLTHLCDESRVAAEVDAAALPVSSGATRAQALSGGEDYELLFTAPPEARMPDAILGVPVTKIGRLVARRKGRAAVTLVSDGSSQPLVPQGWEHFR
jgi:thiamine-monophosphate kinase